MTYQPSASSSAFRCIRDGGEFRLDAMGVYRCESCADMWCECCNDGTYCRCRCPSHPKPSQPASDWFGKPWVASLSAVPGTETEPENAKSAASTAVGRDVT